MPPSPPLSGGGLCCCRRAAALATLAAIAASLQGCVLDIPRHYVGNWQTKESYLEDFSYVVPGSDGKTGLNSCADDSVASSLQCTGHGHCRRWFPEPPLGWNVTDPGGGPSFCVCDRDWADPECSTPRKSQLTAFALSMVLGLFGADQFYLGWWGLGTLKLCTLGGLGVWWVFDVVRIGSSPVETAHTYRLANDVEHWAFVLLLLCFTGIVGFGASVWSIQRQRLHKAREMLVLGLEGGVPMGYGATAQGPAPGRPQAEVGFRGYATTLGAGTEAMQRP